MIEADFWPLLALETNCTMEMPTPCVSPGSGKLSTLLHVTAPSSLLHRPFLRDPKKRISGLLGSTASRSPFERPFSLPPSLKGRGVTCQVLPRSLERSIAPLVL